MLPLCFLWSPFLDIELFNPHKSLIRVAVVGIFILGLCPGKLRKVAQKGRHWIGSKRIMRKSLIPEGMVFQAGAEGLTRTWSIRELGIFGESLSYGWSSDS